MRRIKQVAAAAAVGLAAALLVPSEALAAAPVDTQPADTFVDEVVSVGFPPVDDLVPQGTDLKESRETIETGLAPGLTSGGSGWFNDHFKFSLQGQGPPALGPVRVNATFRSSDPAATYSVWGTAWDSQTPASIVGVDQRLELTLGSDRGWQLQITPDRHGQFSLLLEEVWLIGGVEQSTCTWHRLESGYARYFQETASHPGLAFTGNLYQPVGSEMSLQWSLNWSMPTGVTSTVTVQPLDPADAGRWRVLTGNGATRLSPIKVTADGGSPYDALVFIPEAPGDYRVTLTISGLPGVSLSTTLRAATGIPAVESLVPIEAPDSECPSPQFDGAGHMPDPQLLVNGVRSNDLVVASGEPVTLSFPGPDTDPGLPVSASLVQVWGLSTWRALSQTQDVPLAPGGRADVVLAFEGEGCNLVRMAYSLDGEMFAYVRVMTYAGPALSQTENFVNEVYADLFGRAPDQAGFDYWVGAINAGVPRPAIADSLTASYEFRANMVADNFDWYLGRATDPGGLAYWVSRMNAGLTIEGLEGMITASAEYYTLCGATTSGWVDCLYADVLLRAPDPGGAAYWASLVNAGYDKAQITTGILMSPEALQGRVDGIYQWLLQRPSDPAGRVYWAQQIAGGYRDEQIIAGIIASTEYWQLAQVPWPKGARVLAWGRTEAPPIRVSESRAHR